MNERNPIRPQHRERLLDLSGNTHIARPTRLDLSTDDEHPRAIRRRLFHEAFRHESDDPDSWVNRHLQHRIQKIRERGESAPDVAVSVSW